MPNATTFLTVALTVAITLVLHRVYQPDVWVGIAMAIGVATAVAIVLVTLQAQSIRFSSKKPTSRSRCEWPPPPRTA